MTDVRVVDASALAAILFSEPEADEVALRLEGAILVAPALLSFELANICLKKCLRYPDQRQALLAAHHARTRLSIREVAVDADELPALALKTGLTAYDASYLLLSRLLDAELVTLDKTLGAAAKIP